MGPLARFARMEDVPPDGNGKEDQAMNATIAAVWRFKILLRSLTVIGLLAILPACGGGGGGDDGDGGDGGGGSATYWSGTTPTGTPVFVSRYMFGNFGGATSVLENPDHTFMFAGFRLPDVGPVRIHVAKTDANGGVLWEKSYLSPDNNSTYANSLRRTPDGGYIVAGEAMYASTPCFYLLKTDASGNTQWSRPYTGAIPGLNGFQSVVQTADGGYVAVGAKDNPAFGKWIDVYLVKTDAQGIVQEEHFYGGNGPDYGTVVAQTTDGGFVIAGEFDGGSPANAVYLVKTDAARNEAWSRTYGHGAARAVVQAPDDGFVLTGYLLNAAGNKDLFVMKTNAAGDIVATKTFGGTRDDEGRGIAVTNDGGYVVVGSTHSYSPGSSDAADAWQREDVFLVRLTANLDTVWQAVKGRAPDSGDNGGAVIETSDNNFLVGGTLGGGIILAKFDRNGVTATLGETDFTFRPTATVGTINMSNATEAAGAGATSFDIVRTIGPFGLDLLIGVLGGDVPADFCTAGGTYNSTLTPGPVGAGSIFSVTFQNCVANLGGNVTFNGTYEMTFDNVTGAFPGTSFTVDTRVHLDNLVFTDDVGSTGLQGDLRFRRAATATDNTDQSDSPSAASLAYSTDGIILQIGPFAVQSAETATLVTLGPASATIVHNGIGSLQASTTATISGPSSMAPDSGAFVTRATDNSSVTATVSSGGNVSLAVDTDGNGTTDGTSSTTWDDLLY
jgi:hypothetical protein